MGFFRELFKDIFDLPPIASCNHCGWQSSSSERPNRVCNSCGSYDIRYSGLDGEYCANCGSHSYYYACPNCGKEVDFD